MKVVLLNTYDSNGGAARAALRLHNAMLRENIDSMLFVRNKATGEASIQKPISFIEKAWSPMQGFVDRMPLLLHPNPPVCFSPGGAWSPVSKRIIQRRPDIVHFHWILAGFVKIQTIGSIARHFPVVWTLHDSWGFTGGCNVPLTCTKYVEKCGKCPQLKSNRDNDLSRSVWKRKNRAWKGSNFTLVSPSRWLARQAQASSLFRNNRIEVIPNGIDTTVFKPLPKNIARAVINISNDKKIITFSAAFPEDPNKGLKLLQQALAMLNMDERFSNVEILLIGNQSNLMDMNFNFPVRYMGSFQDDTTLAILYSASDLIVVPSYSENLPYTAIESMACGTPCVSFDVGGFPDIIDHKENGYLAKPHEISDLAEGIRWILGDQARYSTLSFCAREKIVKCFGMDVVVQQHIALYKELIQRKRSSE